MKLKNLLFATMFACAFASCSSDDDNSNPVVTPDGDGVAEIMVNPDLLRGNIESKASTKAVVDPSVYEKYIVYVFNRSSGKNLGHGQPGTAFTVTDNPGQVDVMVVGNVGSILDGTENKAAVFEKTKNFDNNEESGVSSTETTSQSSHLYTFNLQSGKTNKIGYQSSDVNSDAGEVLLTPEKIQLYRHVAKIALNRITVEAKTLDIDGNPVIYSNPKLKVKSAFILNAQYSTKLAAAGRWGSVFNDNGTTVMGSVDLAQFNKWITGAKELADNSTELPYIPVDEVKVAENYKQHTNYESSFSGVEITTVAPKVFSTDNDFYVYESKVISNPTLLVVEGDFSYDNIAGTDPQRITENGYYTVQLGVGDLTASLDTDLFPNAPTKNMGVRRNIQYNVNMTVRAPGSQNPLIPNTKVGALDTQIELVDYGQVSSESTFE